jgi:hypothetical protein
VNGAVGAPPPFTAAGGPRAANYSFQTYNGRGFE